MHPLNHVTVISNVCCDHLLSTHTKSNLCINQRILELKNLRGKHINKFFKDAYLRIHSTKFRNLFTKNNHSQLQRLTSAFGLLLKVLLRTSLHSLLDLS